jgi:hypothetical protein
VPSTACRASWVSKACTLSDSSRTGSRATRTIPIAKMAQKELLSPDSPSCIDSFVPPTTIIATPSILKNDRNVISDLQKELDCRLTLL